MPFPVKRLRWFPIVAGALVALAGGSLLAVVLGAFGVTGGDGGQILLVFLTFLMQLGAGYVAARLSSSAHPFHGANSALVLYAVTATLALLGGRDPAIAGLAVGAVLATVIGGIGGVLGGRVRS